MSDAPYKQMTRNQRRKAIAEDTLRWLDSGRFGDVRSRGWYVKVLHEHKHECHMPWQSDSAFTKREAKKLARHCHVCARGALLLARIGEFNGVSKDIIQMREDGPFMDDDSTTAGLGDAFTARMLDDIEACFEGKTENRIWSKIYQNYSSEDVLRMILQNIIDHDGDFTMSAEYEMVPA